MKSSELKKKREDKGYTRKELAKVLSISPRSLEAYEQGLRKTACMELQTAVKMSYVLDIDIKDLLD